jgi:chemotaxis protein MotB
MITYGDMATLLLVFFVFLFSVSEVRQEKFKAAAGSLRAQIGVKPLHGSVIESRPPVQTRRRDRREKERRGLPGTSEHVLAAAQGKRSAVGGRVQFAPGSTELGDEAKHTLRLIADELRGLRNIIEVRGHAEAGECGGDEGRAADLELDLSLARAATVLRFLAEDAGLGRWRLRAMGAGSAERADAEIYKDEPARDRRVEIIVVRELVKQDKKRKGTEDASDARGPEAP